MFGESEVGPFTEEQVARYLQEGYLTLSDLAKEENDLNWTPLRILLAVHPLPGTEPQPTANGEHAATPMEAQAKTVEAPPTIRAGERIVIRNSQTKYVSLKHLSAKARATDKLPVVSRDDKPVPA
jgi:hypothetical protein